MKLTPRCEIFTLLRCYTGQVSTGRRFGTALVDGAAGCPEMSYQSKLRYIPEEWKSLKMHFQIPPVLVANSWSFHTSELQKTFRQQVNLKMEKLISKINQWKLQKKPAHCSYKCEELLRCHGFDSLFCNTLWLLQVFEKLTYSTNQKTVQCRTHQATVRGRNPAGHTLNSSREDIGITGNTSNSPNLISRQSCTRTLQVFMIKCRNNSARKGVIPYRVHTIKTSELVR